MKIYHIVPMLLIAATAASAQNPVLIVFDDVSMTRHRLAGEETVALPANAAARPWDGFSIEVDVTPEGAVAAARLSDTRLNDGADPAAALAAASAWRFRPFLYRGRAVPARGIVHIGFRNEGGWLYPEAALPPIDYGHLRIRLTRSACFGACPDYAVTIDGDGAILFSTQEASMAGAPEVHRAFSSFTGVLVPGTHQARIDRPTLDALIERFRAAHFFGLKPEYVDGVTDNPTYELTFESGGRRFSVVDYVGGQAGMPSVVTELENAVDTAAGTSRWVQGDAGTIPSLRSEGFDFGSPDAARLALLAAISDESSDQLVLDMIAAGLPLGQPFAVARGEAAAPLGEALLMAAVGRHRLPVVTLLAEQGWLARIPRARLSSLFAETAGGCNPAIARMLVAAGADPKARAGVPRGESRGGGASALRVATRTNGFCSHVPLAPLVSALIAIGVDVNAADDAGETALFEVEDPDLQEQLLASGAHADVRNRQGNSPAFSSWNDRIVLGLLEAGADPRGHYYDGHDLRRQARERDMPSVLAWLDAHGIR